MKIKYIAYILVFALIPIIACAVSSRYGPWWGLREQASAPTTPSNGIKFWCDSSNNTYVLNESGSNYQLDVYDPNAGLTDPTSIGTLTLGSASITDTSGTIDLGDENFTTTGSITGAPFYVDGYIYRSTSDNNTGIYFADDRISVYAGARTMLDAREAAQNYVYLGYDGSNDIDVSIGPNAAIAVAGDTGDVTMTGNITNSWIPKVSHSVGAEAGDIIAVTVTIANYGGTTIAKNCLINLWLSDTSGGAPTSTAPDGSGTAADGWVTSDATEMEEITAEIYYQILTGSDGDATISIKDDDADNDWYLCGEIDGVVYCSAVIDHAL